MLLSAVKLFLFIMSMTGFVFYTRRNLNIQVEFIPIIVITMLSNILFLSGMLNILPLMIKIIFILGVIILVSEIFIFYKSRLLLFELSRYITPGIIVFIIAAFFYLLLLKDQRLIHYDNFSHWGLVVKNILYADALPTLQNAKITYNSYPTGSAMFIYYFCKIVGMSEGLAIFGQMIVLLSGLLSLFSFTSYQILSKAKTKIQIIKKNVINIIIILLCIYLLNGPSPIHGLLVDTLLNVIGLSMFVIIYYYFETPQKIVIPIISLVVYLTLVKNSGLFFVYFSLFFYAVSIIRHGFDKRLSIPDNLFNFRKYIPIYVLPVLIFYLWSKRVEMVFSGGREGRHTMSIESYANIFKTRTSDELQTIIRSFLNTISNEFTFQIILVSVFLIVFVFIHYFTKKKIAKRLIVVATTTLGMYIIYNIGLLGVYIFSMPIGEAIRLAGYRRYIITVVNFLVGVATITIIHFLNKEKEIKKIAIPIFVLFIFLLNLTVFDGKINESKEVFSNKELRINTKEPTLENIDLALSHLPNNLMTSIDSGKYHYNIYIPIEGNTGYERYYLAYKLYHYNFQIIQNLNNLEEILASDYLTITIVDEDIKNIFLNYSSIKPEIGTYIVDKENQMILDKIN